jgi:hypothetical protein
MQYCGYKGCIFGEIKKKHVHASLKKKTSREKCMISKNFLVVSWIGIIGLLYNFHKLKRPCIILKVMSNIWFIY